MIDESMIYWMTRLDAIKSVITLVAAVLGGVCWMPILFGAISWVDAVPGSENKKLGLRVLTVGVSVALFVFVMLVGNAFIPTTREMAAIKIIPRIANSEDVQALGSEIPKLAREWLEELRPKKTPVKAEAEAK
jgi:hypothetical protein